MKPYKAPSQSMAYTLQEPFKKELECLQQQHIIVPLGVDKTSDWCNSFNLVPKSNGSVCLYCDPTGLNQAFIRLVHGALNVTDIFPKPTNAYYLTLIDASSGYQMDT